MKICDLALFSLSSGSGVRTYITSKIGYVSRHPQIDHVVIVPGPADCTITHGRSKLYSVVRGIESSYPAYPPRYQHRSHRQADRAGVAGPHRAELPVHLAVGRVPRHSASADSDSRDLPHGRAGVRTPLGAQRRHRYCLQRRTAWRPTKDSSIGITVTIALNAGMRDRVKQCLGVRRIRCLPCGVDATVFHPARRDPTFRNRLRIEPDQTAIFYAGRLSPEKELDVLFAAFERLPPRKFVLIVAGDGPGAGEV